MMVAPAGPEVGLSVRTRDPVTVKSTEAESPVGLAVTVILYSLGPGTVATMKEANMVPPETEQDEVSTGTPDNEQLVSAVENPDPPTSTDPPTGP